MQTHILHININTVYTNICTFTFKYLHKCDCIYYINVNVYKLQTAILNRQHDYQVGKLQPICKANCQ